MEAAVVCTANLKRKCSKAATFVIMPVCGLINGFVNIDRLLRIVNNVMSNPKV